MSSLDSSRGKRQAVLVLGMHRSGTSALTGVIAYEFYRQYFTARNFGVGSALAIVLLVAVIPVMVYNLRRFRGQEGFK